MDTQIQLGKYRLFHHLASGGMGEVFLAVNEGPAGFSKNVVVKRILASVASDPAFVTMFLNEARLAALIEHPNVVQIFELGFEENTYFIAMEYVKGRSLRHVKHQLVEKKKAIPPEVAARICSQALQGLHHAHNLTNPQGEPLNIVHRDVSPDNLLVGFNGVVKVLDFGIAKAEVNVSTTVAGAVKGKYAYMAPEALTGKAVDRRVDIYAMGVLLYELLSGTRPFNATSEAGLIRAILQDDAPPLLAVDPDLPEPLNTIVMRAMSRDPSDRFATAEEMSHCLEAYIQSTGKTVTNAHVGALLNELFPEAASSRTPVPPSAPHPVSFGLTPASIVRGGTKASLKAAEDSLPEIDIVDSEDEAKGFHLGRLKPAWIAGAAVAAVALIVAGVALVMPKSSSAPTSASAQQVASPSAQAAAQRAEAEQERVAAPAPIEAPKHVVSEPVLAAAVPPPSNAAALAAPSELPAAAAPTQTAKASPSKRGRASAASRKELAQAPAPAPTPVATTGRVLLRVNPWAEVFWSGKSMGVTPMDAVELPVGTQVLTLRNPNLKLEKKVSVTVQPDREVVLKADLLD